MNEIEEQIFVSKGSSSINALGYQNRGLHIVIPANFNRTRIIKPAKQMFDHLIKQTIKQMYATNEKPCAMFMMFGWEIAIERQKIS